jgi:hypothetical protein
MITNIIEVKLSNKKPNLTLTIPTINQSKIFIVVFIFVKPTSYKIKIEIKKAIKINKLLKNKQKSRPKNLPLKAKKKKLSKGNHKTKLYTL